MSETNTKIGNYTITDVDIDTFISGMPQEQQMYRSMPEFRKQCEERLEEICLFAMYGEEEKKDETEMFKTSMVMAKRDILSQIAMADLLKDISVTDAEAKEYFLGHSKEFASKASATAKHVLVDNEDKANQIKEEIESGAKSFEDAAKEYSTCPSAQKGGSLGTFGRGQMVKEFENAVFDGELNKVIGPVKTQFGYHLIWVDDKNEGEVPEYDSNLTRRLPSSIISTTSAFKIPPPKTILEPIRAFLPGFTRVSQILFSFLFKSSNSTLPPVFSLSPISLAGMTFVLFITRQSPGFK